MKKILCFALLALVFFAMGICAAEVPNLLGKWTGVENWYGEDNGSVKLIEDKSLNVTIVDQKDRLFTGNMAYIENGTKVVEGFSGAIGLDNKTLYMAEFKEGYDLGTIISKNDIELIYLEAGKNGGAEIDRLHRINMTNVTKNVTNVTKNMTNVTKVTTNVTKNMTTPTKNVVVVKK
jgi:hypothetical protein